MKRYLLLFLALFLALFCNITSYVFPSRRLIICNNIPADIENKDFFNKLVRNEMISPDDISRIFPILTSDAGIIARVINQYQCDYDVFTFRLPFRWCACLSVDKPLRLFLLLCQVRDIVNNFPDKTQLFVHTSFAEGGLLQSWRLAYLLLNIGYTRLHFNLIGLNILGLNIGCGGYSFRDFTSERLAHTFCQSLNRDRVTVSIYESSVLYLENTHAILSHSFDMVDGGGEMLDGSAPYSTQMFRRTALNYCPLVLLYAGNVSTCFALARIYLSHHEHALVHFDISPKLRPLEDMGNPRHEKNERLNKFVRDLVESKLSTFCGIGLSREGFISRLVSFFRICPTLQSMSREGFPLEDTDNIWVKMLLTQGDAKLSLRFFHSLPLEFSEIIDKRRACEEPIIYEAQRKWLSIHNGYFEPDFALYSDREF